VGRSPAGALTPAEWIILAAETAVGVVTKVVGNHVAACDGYSRWGMLPSHAPTNVKVRVAPVSAGGPEGAARTNEYRPHTPVNGVQKANPDG
jgi:hypothetical protein